MRFSIIIPVYNVEEFLPKCLDSALCQTYANYEIIAVNDGSTDGSRKVLSQYEHKNSRIKVIDQENKGLGGARNTGIQYANGEFLFFLDSDDYIPSTTLEEIDYYLKNYNLDMLAFDCNMVDTAGQILQIATVNAFSEEFTLLNRKQFMLLEPTACLKVYRRLLYMTYSISFPEHLWYEDLATVFKLVPHANLLGYLKKPLYNYVQHSTSITHSRNTKRMMEIIPAFESTLVYYRQQNLFDEFYDELEWNCILHVLYYSAFRFLGHTYDRKDMTVVYQYSKRIFPRWEGNKYLKQMEKSKYLMSLITHHKCFNFYLKTGFFQRFISPVLVKTQKIRGVFRGNKTTHS
jgi:glycosyltransferase involved in cell wall biosynthesis